MAALRSPKSPEDAAVPTDEERKEETSTSETEAAETERGTFLRVLGGARESLRDLIAKLKSTQAGKEAVKAVEGVEKQLDSTMLHKVQGTVHDSYAAGMFFRCFSCCRDIAL